MLSGMSRSSTAAALLGWFLASFLGGLISILVSRLELSSASRLRAAAFSEAVLSEVALLEESCASEMAVSSPKKTTVNRVRTTLLHRDANREAGGLPCSTADHGHKSRRRPQRGGAGHITPSGAAG